MTRLLRTLLAAAVLASSLGQALAVTQPAVNIPSLADWEQNALQNLTGSYGVPLAIGAPPALTGSCTTGTQVGGQSAGSFKAGASCSAGTVILTFTSPAPNGFECGAKDMTTTADTLLETATSTTSVTFTGTMASADVVLWSCRAF